MCGLATEMGVESGFRWRWRAWAWGMLWAGVIALLTVLLWRRANPWSLQLLIPSGYNEKDYAGVWTEPSQVAQISPDGRMLAVARPNGQAEVWDLGTIGVLAATLAFGAAWVLAQGAMLLRSDVRAVLHGKPLRAGDADRQRGFPVVVEPPASRDPSQVRDD